MHMLAESFRQCETVVVVVGVSGKGLSVASSEVCTKRAPLTTRFSILFRPRIDGSNSSLETDGVWGGVGGSDTGSLIVI